MHTLLLFLSRSQLMQRVVTHLGFARRAARRFVAGESVQESIAAARDSTLQGYATTLNLLGESVLDEADAARATDDYLNVLAHIAEGKLHSVVAVKLTQLGLDLNRDLCAANLARILAKAKEAGVVVEIDMENSACTDPTLDIFREVQVEYENLGICIQAYLYRSQDDLQQLIRDGARVRLVKGTYKEPQEIAFRSKKEVDHNLVTLIEMMLRATARRDGGSRPYLALASHDEKMVEAVKLLGAELGLPKDAYEFQMLYGIRRDLQQQLLEGGYIMRVYIPFGNQWYPYFMRRLAERPANLWFLLSNFLRS